MAGRVSGTYPLGDAAPQETAANRPHAHDNDWGAVNASDGFSGMALHWIRSVFSRLRSKREQLAQLRAVQLEQRIAHLERDKLHLAEANKQLIQRVAKARYLANHDGLTGLCNRSMLMDRFVHSAAQAQRGGLPMAVLLLDLDEFKAVNDLFGHLAGDRLLQRVAECLRMIARAGDTPCRYGGDEFLLLLPGVQNMAVAKCVEQRIHHDILSCLRRDGIDIDVTVSCGIALYPGDGDNWNALMSAADAAMYQSKSSRAKPNCWRRSWVDPPADHRVDPPRDSGSLTRHAFGSRKQGQSVQDR